MEEKCKDVKLTSALNETVKITQLGTTRLSFTFVFVGFIIYWVVYWERLYFLTFTLCSTEGMENTNTSGK